MSYKRPVHEICTDKSECKNDYKISENGELALNEIKSTPIGHLTKDHIRKCYELKQAKEEK